MLKKVACFLAFVVLALPGVVCAQAPVAVVVERNVPMKTRDGVTLHADVYRPADNGTYPVLLKRTPYDKGNDVELGMMFARRGYITVIQDVRGRYTSEGEWYPFRYEINDGYDAVEWAAKLPHSDGRVGMFSGSYVGATQMLAAIAHPPHLAGICPVVTASNYHSNWTYQGGAFEQWFDQSWTTGLAQDTANRAVKQASDALVGSTRLPLTQFPVFNLESSMSGTQLTHALAPYYLDWLAHPNYDSYWKQWSIEENYANIKVPALVIAAWYDLFQGGSLRNYLGIRAQGGTEAARDKTQLVIAIGGHSGWGRKVGEVDFGPEAKFDENAITLDWYDYLFKGKQNEFASGKPVRLFLMGKDQWQSESSWPLKNARETRYYLHSEGRANSAAGDGVLSTRAGGKELADSYVYDPANPVPTQGGPLCCDTAHLAPGPQDQRSVEARQDVLVYSTPPLAQDTEVTGPITLDLYAHSSAVDTDFTGKLVDVGPDGFARNLTEGILRARFRDSQSEPTLITPGKVYEYKIDLWATGNVFLKGHRIRLEVSSSNFPRFDRNLNTGKSGAESSDYVKATNVILHDAEHPSALVLPVVPAE